MQINKILTCLTKLLLQPDAKPIAEPFSELKDVKVYIPQIYIPSYNVSPYLLCDISCIDRKYIGWEHPEGDHDLNNLIYRVPGLKGDIRYHRDLTLNIFDIVRYWPPGAPEVTTDEIHKISISKFDLN